MLQFESKFHGFMYIFDHIFRWVLQMVFETLEEPGAHQDGVPAIVRFIVRSLYVRLRSVPYHVEVRDLYPL